MNRVSAKPSSRVRSFQSDEMAEQLHTTSQAGLPCERLSQKVGKNLCPFSLFLDAHPTV